MLIIDQLKKNDPHLRLLAFGILGGMVLLLAGLWWVQIVSAREYQQHLETQSYRSVRIPAERGRILDRNGVALAENRPSYNVSLYLEELRDRFQEEYNRMRPMRVITNASPFWKLWRRSGEVQTQRARLTKAQVDALAWQVRYEVASNLVQQVSRRLQVPLDLDFERFRRHYLTSLALPYPVADNIGPAQIARFEEQAPTPLGMDLEIQPTRFYPYSNIAAHVLGHLIRDDSSMQGEDAFFSYRLPDYRGVIGIEYGFDAQLHGRAGEKSETVNNLGYRQSENVLSPAEPGSDVVLTIDLRIQEAAERALEHAPVEGPPCGAAVVLDVSTGDILALASVPSFDPNVYIPKLSAAESARLQDKTLRPEINRATQEIYAPGSIFKPIVGLACLEAGLDPNATIHNPGFIKVGRRIGDLAPAGEYDFRKAIMESCNTYFISNGLKAGIERIIKLGEELHLGERMGLPTRQDHAGQFPTLKQVRAGWSAGLTALICIGQGDIAVTPLQMTVMTAALANGGKVLWPRLVDRIEPQDPASDQPTRVFPKGAVRDHLEVSPRNLKLLKDAMLAEVQEGTGRAAMVPGLQICGKTGTAQVMDQHNREIDTNTWFISFAPYEHPRYAVVVMIEHGRFGGTTCAPVAKQIYTAILESERRRAAGSGTMARAN